MPTGEYLYADQLVGTIHNKSAAGWGLSVHRCSSCLALVGHMTNHEVRQV